MYDWSEQRARRRHQITNSSGFTGSDSTVGGSTVDQNQSSSARVDFSREDVDAAKKQQSQRGFSGFLPGANSFSGLSQYTSQIWNTAQVRLIDIINNFYM